MTACPETISSTAASTAADALVTPAIPRPLLLRVLKDVLRAELKARSAVTFTEAQAAAWDESTELGSPTLPVDSLELVSITGRVNQLFHLHESGVEEGLLSARRLGAWVDLVEQARGPRLTFLTSGSTGVPKPCEHERAALWQEIDALKAIFPGVRRVVSLAPTNHIYGFLFGVLLPLGLEAEALDARALSPAALGVTLGPGDLVVGVPTHHGYLARSVRSLSGSRLVVSTGSLDAATLEALGHLGAGGVTEIYGSTETGGIGWRRVPTTGEPAGAFTLHPFWEPMFEADPADEPVSVPEPAAGRAVTALIRRPPDGTRSAPASLMDRLVFASPARFTLCGRVDAAVKVGGINVFPRRVEQVLREHPGVADCRVRLMRPEEGERLKAFIVPTLGATRGEEWESDLRAAIEGFARDRLSAPERPRHLAFGPALPVNELGKPADW